LGEVTRTYLASSTRPVNGLGEAQLFCVITHSTHLHVIIWSAASASGGTLRILPPP
jgi:hypothetical protein